MSDLTEFLLARIEEDEQSWRTAYHPTNPMSIFLLAECKAKRRILSEGTITYGQRVNGEPSALHWNVLTAFAAVYSDHPDYDPSWRSD